MSMVIIWMTGYKLHLLPFLFPPDLIRDSDLWYNRNGIVWSVAPLLLYIQHRYKLFHIVFRNISILNLFLFFRHSRWTVKTISITSFKTKWSTYTTGITACLFIQIYPWPRPTHTHTSLLCFITKVLKGDCWNQSRPALHPKHRSVGIIDPLNAEQQAISYTAWIEMCAPWPDHEEVSVFRWE